MTKENAMDGKERRGEEREKGQFDLLDSGLREVRDSGQVRGFDCEVECDVDVSLNDMAVETDEGSWDGHLDWLGGRPCTFGEGMMGKVGG